MLSIPQTLDAQADIAAAKAAGLRRPGRFLVSGMLAGAYIGVGVILMVSAAGPMLAAGEGLAKLVSGIVFSAALTIVVFAGSDLLTSAMMLLPQGTLMGRLKPRTVAAALTFTFLANLIGALVFAGLIVLSGVLYSNPAAESMLTGMLEAKAHETPLQLFTRGVLCNVLVCLAVWMGTRVRSEGAKIALIFVSITAFVTSGFEHVVANMTTYWIGVLTLDPNASPGNFAGNMLWVGLGNLLGGFIVAAAYWAIGGHPRAARDSKRQAERAQLA